MSTLLWATWITFEGWPIQWWTLLLNITQLGTDHLWMLLILCTSLCQLASATSTSCWQWVMLVMRKTSPQRARLVNQITLQSSEIRAAKLYFGIPPKLLKRVTFASWLCKPAIVGMPENPFLFFFLNLYKKQRKIYKIINKKHRNHIYRLININKLRPWFIAVIHSWYILYNSGNHWGHLFMFLMMNNKSFDCKSILFVQKSTSMQLS